MGINKAKTCLERHAVLVMFFLVDCLVQMGMNLVGLRQRQQNPNPAFPVGLRAWDLKQVSLSIRPENMCKHTFSFPSKLHFLKMILFLGVYLVYFILNYLASEVGKG